METIITGTTCIVVLGIALSMYKVANGRLKNIEEKKVDRSACHIAVKGVNQRIDDFQGHLDTRIDGVNTRIDDLKDMIKRNGK